MAHPCAPLTGAEATAHRQGGVATLPGVGLPPTSFAVVIPARDEAPLLAQTIAAVADQPTIDLVVVVDDGSADDTAGLAESAGATVVRHIRPRGKGAALTTGADLVARSAATTDTASGRRGLVFLDADAGASAGGIVALTSAVIDDRLDLAIAHYTARGGTGGHGFVVRLAREAIHARTGWRPEIPLSGIRALTIEAYGAVSPLAPGWGIETAMTIDACRAGLRVGEVATSLTHRATGSDVAAQWHRARQYVDVRRALLHRRGTLASSRLTR